MAFGSLDYVDVEDRCFVFHVKAVDSYRIFYLENMYVQPSYLPSQTTPTDLKADRNLVHYEM